MKLLKQIQNLGLPAQLLVVLLGALVWFLPDMFGKLPQHTFDFVILNDIVCFSLAPFWAHFIQFFCLLAISVWGMILCAKHRIIPARSTLPFIIFLIIFATVNRVQFFTNSTVAFFLFLGAFTQLLATYGQKKECVAQAFNIGFFVVCAAIFDYAYIWLIILMLFGLILFGALTTRTFCSFLAGIFMPTALLFGIFTLTDSLPHLLDSLQISNFLSSNSFTPTISEMIFGGFIGVIFLLALLNYIASNTSFNLNVRLSYIFVNCVVVLSLILIGTTLRIDTLLLVPLFFIGLIVSFYLITNDRSKVANVLFLILLIVVLGCRVAQIFGI